METLNWKSGSSSNGPSGTSPCYVGVQDRNDAHQGRAVASMLHTETCMLHTETFMNIRGNVKKRESMLALHEVGNTQSAIFPVDCVLPSSGMLI